MPQYCSYTVSLTVQCNFQQILGKDIHKSHSNYKTNPWFPYSIWKERFLCKLIQRAYFPQNNIIRIINKLVIWLRMRISSLIHSSVFSSFWVKILAKRIQNTKKKETIIIWKNKNRKNWTLILEDTSLNRSSLTLSLYCTSHFHIQYNRSMILYYSQSYRRKLTNDRFFPMLAYSAKRSKESE